MTQPTPGVVRIRYDLMDKLFHPLQNARNVELRQSQNMATIFIGGEAGRKIWIECVNLPMVSRETNLE